MDIKTKLFKKFRKVSWLPFIVGGGGGIILIVERGENLSDNYQIR